MSVFSPNTASPAGEQSTATKLARYGFVFGRNGAHAARTMMLQEFRQLLEHVPPDAPRAEYTRQIIEANALNKPTRKARELTARHLAALYALDPNIALFRALRRLWLSDAAARPLLALMLVLARDPLLRLSWNLILNKKPGDVVQRGEVEAVLQAAHPDRFSPASLKSFAQNINGTWTQAGFLEGRARKTRSVPIVTPANLSYALFLSHLEGASAQRLFSSRWARLMGTGVGYQSEWNGRPCRSLPHRG